MKGFLNEERPVQTLRQVLDRLKETYCGPIGYEVRPRRTVAADVCLPTWMLR